VIENFNFEMCPAFAFSLQLPKLTDNSSYRMLSLPASLRLKSRVRWMLEFQHGKKELRRHWKSRFVAGLNCLQFCIYELV